MSQSLEIEWIKHANFWAKEHSNGSMQRSGYLLQSMATVPSSEEAPAVADEIDVPPFRVCKHALMLVLGIGSTRGATFATHTGMNTFPVHGRKGKSWKQGRKEEG
jgi:hypothetical protein